jgi:hypothetical protein
MLAIRLRKSGLFRNGSGIFSGDERQQSTQSETLEHMKTTFLSTLAIATGAAVLITSTPAAVAAMETYDFTFTGNDGIDATGTIGIEDGAAVSGSIDVTGVPLEATPGTLVTASGFLLPANGPTDAENHDGDVITYDNIVNLANNPVLDGDGLGFGSGQYSQNDYNTVINIWGNSPDSYTLFIGEAQLDANGNVIGDPQWVYALDSGSLYFAAVPESLKWTRPLILGVLMAGSLAIRRKQERRNIRISCLV